MDAGLLWTAVGSAAGVLAAVLAAWQIRLQLLGRDERKLPRLDAVVPAVDVGGLPVTVPVGRLPAEVRGRDALLSELRGAIAGRRRRRARVWVLAGMGGLGKSTVALAVARTARARGWRVWWVTVADAASLAGGMGEILCQLGAPESVIRAVREGTAVAADRAWEFLNSSHRAGSKWLLILDNADAAGVLAAPGSAGPADDTGWVRADPSGVVIVTTRVKDRRVWGPWVEFRELRKLEGAPAARVLADLAPRIAGPGGGQRIGLGRRLGGLPLALHLAGSYLASPFARW